MRIISFGWTHQALLNGRKTVTRRNWLKCPHKVGDLIQAYDRAIFLKGKCIAILRIKKISVEKLCDMPEEDVEKEGGLWDDKEDFINSYLKAYPEMRKTDHVWRIEFEMVHKVVK